ncbi:hypothetical protein Acsp02_10350 [Actinoplanes sp. NBRC 103695]|nr:hypothetical protein Acsp02_10350 [Actinoplanes sp. NBRC 103695]
MSFNGFISYSHAADGRLAPAVQRGLHRLAKPWHRRRALWIFRDQTGLSVTPALWTSIQKALDNSEYFVLMASPEAAQSPWVNREIEHWVATKPLDRILPVVTDGEWRWDPVAKDFDAESTSVPAALRGVFAEEPLYLDLRWARDDRHLSLRHSRFRDAIAQLAAPMHGVSKDDLEGEDVRQHRRAGRMRLSAVASLLVLTVLASVTGLSAVQNAARANASAVEARQQQKEASAQRGHAERFATEAQQQEEKARDQEARARAAAAEADRQEESARAQKALADKAKGDVKVQLDKADKAAARAKEQQRLAARQGVLARESAAESRKQQQRAKEQERIAREQERLAGEAGAEAAKQKKIAGEQQKLAAAAEAQARAQEQIARDQEAKAKEAGDEAARQQKIAISRRLVNQAKATVTDNPRTAFKLGVAAQKVSPTDEIKRDVTGLITSTRQLSTIDDVFQTSYGPRGPFATGAPDGTVSLWDMAEPANPRRLATIKEPGAEYAHVSVSPDGKTLAIGWSDGAALWNVTNPADPVRLAQLPPGRYGVVVFSPDNRTLATGNRTVEAGEPEDDNGYASLWDVTDRTSPAKLSELHGPGMESAYDMAFGNGGQTLVVQHFGAVVWDLTDRANPVKRSQINELHNSAGMAFHPFLSLLAIGDLSGAVTVYDMNDLSQPRVWYTSRSSSHENLTLAYSPDGSRLIAGFYDGTTIVWNTAAGNMYELARVTGRVGVTSLGMSRDNRTLLTVESAETAVLWNMEDFATPERRATLPGHDNGVLSVTYSTDGKTLMSIGWDNQAIFWDVSGSEPVRRATVPLLNGRRIVQGAISADGRTAVAVDNDGLLLLTDTSDPANPAPFAGTHLGNSLSLIQLSPDGSRLALIVGTHLQMFDVSEHRGMRLLTDMPIPVQPPRAMAFSPDGQMLAFTYHKTVNLWDLRNPASPQKVATLSGHADQTMSVAFGPTGKTVATGSADRTVILWDITDLKEPERYSTLTGAYYPIARVAFSANGRTLIAGETSRSSTIWDVAEPARPIRLSRILTNHAYERGALAFSPDGRTLAVGTDQDLREGVGIWDLTRQNNLRADPGAFGCTVTGKGLTEREWVRLIPELPYERTCAG